MPPVERLSGARLMDGGGEHVAHTGILSLPSSTFERPIEHVRIAGCEFIQCGNAQQGKIAEGRLAYVAQVGERLSGVAFGAAHVVSNELERVGALLRPRAKRGI